MMQQLTVMCVLLLTHRCVCWGDINASDSDDGKLTLIANGGDAYISFVDDLEMHNKIHWVIGFANCNCVGAADIIKINQLDYAAFKNYLFSYAMYINDGVFYDRIPCTADAIDLQAKTTLKYNVLPMAPAVALAHRHEHFTTRVHGIILAQAIDDFISHSYVVKHRQALYGTDVGGGIFYTQETMFIRPCAVWPHVLPFLSSTSRVSPSYSFRYTLPYDSANARLPFYGSADAELFINITTQLKSQLLLTRMHEDNLADNTGATSHMRAFAFDSVFIPHRYVHDFQALLVPFAMTRLSPDLYVPFIFQSMWRKSDWVHIGPNNDTMYISETPVLNIHSTWLTTCTGATVEETKKNVNEELVGDVYYFEHYCGSYVDIEYILRKTKYTVLFHFYEIMFYLILALLVIRYTVRHMRSLAILSGRCYGCILKRCKKYCPSCAGYTRMNNTHTTATAEMSAFDALNDDSSNESAHVDV